MRSRRAPRSPPGHAREHWPRTIAIEGDVTAVVVMHAVASMDGYIADTDEDVGPPRPSACSRVSSVMWPVS
jgi:hypothetical protein